MNEYELDAIENEMAEGCNCIPEVSSERANGIVSVAVRHEDHCKISRACAANNN